MNAEVADRVADLERAVSRLADIVEDRNLDEFEAASRVGCSVAKLRKDRTLGRGLPYFRDGRTIRYRLKDVVAFIDERMTFPSDPKSPNLAAS